LRKAKREEKAHSKERVADETSREDGEDDGTGEGHGEKHEYVWEKGTMVSPDSLCELEGGNAQAAENWTP
jgi:hypothetical protein